METNYNEDHICENCRGRKYAENESTYFPNIQGLFPEQFVSRGDSKINTNNWWFCSDKCMAYFFRSNWYHIWRFTSVARILAEGLDEKTKEKILLEAERNKKIEEDKK